jgi:hypothetical protein
MTRDWIFFGRRAKFFTRPDLVKLSILEKNFEKNQFFLILRKFPKCNTIVFKLMLYFKKFRNCEIFEYPLIALTQRFGPSKTRGVRKRRVI